MTGPDPDAPFMKPTGTVCRRTDPPGGSSGEKADAAPPAARVLKAGAEAEAPAEPVFCEV